MDPFNPNSPDPMLVVPRESPVPTPGPNRGLPPMNPLDITRARSTIAALLSLLAIIGPLLGGGIGEVAAEILANGDAVQQQTETLIDAINAIIGVGALVWFWLERRAPNFRLSFNKD